MSRARTLEWMPSSPPKILCSAATVSSMRSPRCLLCSGLLQPAMFQESEPELSAGPTWRALLQKRRNAFLRVRRQRVHRHDFLGVGVGFGLVQVDLRVVCLLAQ